MRHVYSQRGSPGVEVFRPLQWACHDRPVEKEVGRGKHDHPIVRSPPEEHGGEGDTHQGLPSRLPRRSCSCWICLECWHPLRRGHSISLDKLENAENIAGDRSGEQTQRQRGDNAPCRGGKEEPASTPRRVVVADVEARTHPTDFLFLFPCLYYHNTSGPVKRRNLLLAQSPPDKHHEYELRDT